MKDYKLGFIIGRFQPFHDLHLALLTEALNISDRVVICIGSVEQKRSVKNPFTFDERVQLIQCSLGVDQLSRITFEGIEDTISDAEWFSNISDKVIDNLWEDSTQGDIVLVGHKKDESSFYLNHFPNFEYHEFESYSNLGATDIRDSWYNGETMSESPLSVRCAFWLEGFRLGKDFYSLKEQYKFKDYPYKESLNICTADALVVNSRGEYLFITRKTSPCKGMLALAGGHKDSDETFYECAKRELEEETGLTRKDIVLTNVGRMFDDPSRDPVMTKVSIPFLFTLVSDKKVVALDDAEEVYWLTEEEVHSNKGKIAFDHYDMFLHLTNEY